jgi:hypothetical protein
MKTSYSSTSSPVSSTNGNYTANSVWILNTSSAAANGTLSIEGANMTTGQKHFEWKSNGQYANQSAFFEGFGNWQNSAAVTSASFILSSSTFSFGTIYAYGCN